MATYRIYNFGHSRSFPVPHAFIDGGITDDQKSADVAILIGEDCGRHLADLAERHKLVLIELYTECLGVWTGENAGREGSNVLGFSRFRLGDDEPTRLVELVRQPCSDAAALATAISLLEQAGFDVATCQDQAGRIVDRLIRPYFNEVLKRLDEGLASADDMDLTLKLGLGYPEGPVGLLERSGLHHHHDVTSALAEVYGTAAFAPARRAVVAKQRRNHQEK